MITGLTLSHFKGFAEYEVKFDRLNLLVGGNNSGKTTVFHALQLAFWCVEQTVDISDNDVTFRKTQLPEIGALPYFNHRDIFHNQQVQDGKRPARIRIQIRTDSTPPLEFRIYRAFSRNLMIDGSGQGMDRASFDALLRMKPVYIPAAVGITVQEGFLRAVSQERLISEGRQNQVLRNLVYRLSKDPVIWGQFIAIVAPLFALEGLQVPFDERKDEWLSATYRESGCEYDLISAGSGFLQTLNLMCFLLLNESATALLDEPDSHMHDDLQRVVFDALNQLSKARDLQVIIATHSSTLVDAAGLESVLLIDKTCKAPLVAQDVDTLIPLLSDQGLSLPPNKVLETLRVRRALFVEGLEADYEEFIAILGETVIPGFGTHTRGLKVFATGGTNRWPYDAIDCFQELLGAELEYLYLSDRDFLTDSEVSQREQRAHEGNRRISHLDRRHRESYLLNPVVIARSLEARWRAKSEEPAPEEIGEVALTDFILKEARSREDETRNTLFTEHEPILRGDSAHRKAGLALLSDYFRESYTEVLGNGQIPFKLLDSKAVLRALRRHLADEHGLSFSDADICQEYRPEEIPSDLVDILRGVAELFGEVHPAADLGLRTERQSPAQGGLFDTMEESADEEGS